MKINISSATFSSIVGIGQKIEAIEKETGRRFLKLNRGVNAVTNIDLSKIKELINFNSTEFQTYAPNTGFSFLKNSIIKEYGFKDTSLNSISITPGGMPALDLAIQVLHTENIYFPKFYWGSYSKMATIRKKSFAFYDSFLDIDTSSLNDTSCILFCDPNNPTGIKLNEKSVIDKINAITSTGAVVIFDSPYKKLFYHNTDFSNIDLKNVIITESVSKWIGLPGLRLGFIYSENQEFNKELNIRLLYEFNGVSSPSQLIVDKILSTPEGQEAISSFRADTVDHISRNIQYLEKHNFLPKEIYGDNIPLGIFAIVNQTEDKLLQNDIGSVGLDKFVYYDKDLYSSYSRICVSVPHPTFITYFSKLKERL